MLFSRISGFIKELNATYLHPALIALEPIAQASVTDEDVPYRGQFDGWSLFIMNLVYDLQKAKDACDIHENGHTFYEVRLAHAVAEEFKRRTKKVVWPSTIYKIEHDATPHADYASRIAQACWVHELSLKGFTE